MKKVVIIGGGASGILAAIRLADVCRNTSVTILEKNERIGKKLLRTGNGKCNITNSLVTPQSYESDLAKEAIARYDFAFTRAFFESLGLYIKADSAGRCYPLSESANNVLNILLCALEKRGITVKTEAAVTAVKRKNGRFTVQADTLYEADAVLLAIGSAAGVKGYNGYDLLHNLGFALTKPVPALCPVPADESFMKELKGVRVKGSVRLRGHEESGEIQFTDTALSGICVFNLAKYVRDGDCMHLDFNSDSFAPEKLSSIISAKARQGVQNAALLDFLLPRKLAFVILKRAGLSPSGEASTLTDETARQLAALICDFPVKVQQPSDFFHAQSVCGGVESTKLLPHSLQVKQIPGLFISGELLDTDAPCGGFNLQQAWSTGLWAADAIKEYLENKN